MVGVLEEEEEEEEEDDDDDEGGRVGTKMPLLAAQTPS